MRSRKETGLTIWGIVSVATDWSLLMGILRNLVSFCACLTALFVCLRRNREKVCLCAAYLSSQPEYFVAISVVGFLWENDMLVVAGGVVCAFKKSKNETSVLAISWASLVT